MSKVITIDWLSDYYDCEQCGGNYADGARVELDGKVLLYLRPHAHCYGGDHWGEGDVYRAILKALGYDLRDGRYEEADEK